MESFTKKENYDIIVVGGGIAGVAAAVSASREGAKVLLIEKSINLGGLATSGLISAYEPLCDGNGRQMVFGIAEELIRLSVKYCFDNFPEEWGGKGRHFHIPAGALKNKAFPNLFAAGRIISAPQGDPWEITRVIPVCTYG